MKNILAKFNPARTSEGTKKKHWLEIQKNISYVFSTFSLTSKFILIGLIVIGTIFLLAGLWSLSQDYTVTLPATGGSVTEGAIGSPRFINPLLATSDTDRDLSALIYSGLLRIGPNDELIPDLAESYNISDDGLIYTFTLKENLTWHDGRKLTARDIVFTVNKAQDSNTRSPRRANWEGVIVEQTGERTIIFKLARPYAPFIENMTMGILPTHLWSNIEIESFSFSPLNSQPIGSGPYKIAKIKKDRTGVATYYDLEAFSDFALGMPKIKNWRLKFYPNENSLITALIKGEIDSAHSITPSRIKELKPDDLQTVTVPLSRVFGVFFNQNQATLFTKKEVRQALDQATDRDQIIKQVLEGYGLSTTTAIPNFLIGEEDKAEETNPDTETALTLAKATLTDNGWQENENGIMEKTSGGETTLLKFSIATADTPELKATAELLKQNWEALGAEVEIKVFETGNLNQAVIRPRKYDVLLFGLVLGRQPDPFAFWHSSQRLDPGLNIALYTNISADKILEDLHTTLDKASRLEKIKALTKEIEQDIPAIFIYSPKFIYLAPPAVKNISFKKVSDSADRFNNVYNWYIKTEKVWKIFTPKTN